MIDSPTHEPSILVAEDNAGDIRLVRLAIEDSGLRARLVIAGDGEKAMKALRCTDEYESEPAPSLVLLDLNLPRKDGREVLKEIKADADLRTVPVVVLTSSEAPEDIALSYQLSANAYVTKRLALDENIRVLGETLSFWLDVARLPARESS